jgi:hypothetical protein
MINLFTYFIVFTGAFCVGVLCGYLLLVEQFMAQDTKENLARIKQNARDLQISNKTPLEHQ